MEEKGDIMTGATCGAGDAHSSGTPDLAFGFCEGWWRYGILFCDSFLLFGSLFCIDMPTVLQHEIISSPHTSVVYGTNITNSTLPADRRDCQSCLGLGEVRYNLLHSSLRWTSALLCLPIGYFIDRIGNRYSAMFLSTVTCVSTALFALGAVSPTPTTTPMFLLMVSGRVLLASGESPLRIVQDKIIAHWFPGDSYIPLALVLLGRRSGSLLNFLVTANIAKYLGFNMAVSFGTVLTGFSVLCALAFGLLDYYGTRQQDEDTQERITSKTVTLKDLQMVPKRFWIHVVMMAFFYGGYFSFLANVTNYLQLEHGYTMVESSYITGVTQIAPVLSPLVAAILNGIDCNGIMATCGIALMIPAYILFGFYPWVHPVILTVIIGVTNSIAALTLWQVAIVVCPASCFGTVAGIVYSVRNCAVAVALFGIGYILDENHGYVVGISQLERYHHFFITLAATACVSVMCGVVLNVIDLRGDCVINQRIGRCIRQDSEEMSLVKSEETYTGYTSTEQRSAD